MPSTDDFYNRLGDTNNKLDQLHTDVTEVNTSVNTVNSTLQAGFTQLNNTLQAGFSQLVTLLSYADEALYHNSQQNDTIICILEHISQQTCALLNEAATQTRLQTTMAKDMTALEQLYESTHAQAALERQREEALRAQIEACCPPPVPQPPCTYEPCAEPKRLPPPPELTPPRRRG